MKHIIVLSSIKMGARHVAGIRGLQDSKAAIILWIHKNNCFSVGTGVLYGKHGAFFFSKEQSKFNARKLWAAMYATSLITELSADVVALAPKISDSDVELPDSWPYQKMTGWFSYDYPTPLSLRDNVLEQRVPTEELKKFTKEFRRRTRLRRWKEAMMRVVRFIIRA